MYLGGLCFITDCKSSSLSVEEIVFKALAGGVRWIQYREKDKPRSEIYEKSLQIRKLTKDFSAVLIINDHADIAASVDAEGVHLGQEDLPLKEARKILGKNKIIGISTHKLVQAKEAEKGGANYIGFGPVFHTTTKNAGSPIGTDILSEIKEQIRIPIVAIGGINKDNIRSVLNTGADAVAAASAFLSGDIENNVKSFMDIIHSLSFK